MYSIDKSCFGVECEACYVTLFSLLSMVCFTFVLHIQSKAFVILVLCHTSSLIENKFCNFSLCLFKNLGCHVCLS